MQDLIHDPYLVFSSSYYQEGFYQMLIQAEAFGKRVIKISNQVCQGLIIPDKNVIKENIVINNAIKKIINFVDLCKKKFNLGRNPSMSIFDVKFLNKKNLVIYSKLIWDY